MKDSEIFMTLVSFFRYSAVFLLQVSKVVLGIAKERNFCVVFRKESGIVLALRRFALWLVQKIRASLSSIYINY